MSSLPTSREEYRAWWEANAPVPYGYCWCGCGELVNLVKKTYRPRLDFAGEPRRYIIGHQHHKSPIEYLEEDRGYETPCWIWQRGISSTGYGMASNAERRSAHCVVWERVNGPKPKGQELHHKCEVRSCVRPDHLTPLTRQEHTQINYRTKLTPAKVLDIRAAHANGESVSSLARAYGIHFNTIRGAVTRQTWSNL